jgi:hypothetical protein
VLAALEYETRTRGTRFVPAAKPVGEGRYKLLRHRGHTELAYVLELPKVPGPAQDELVILPEASFIVAVKNPEISTPGAPAARVPPAYPEHLRARFGGRRWIDAEPELLDHVNAELLLIAARTRDVETALGIDLEAEDEELATSEVLRELHVSSRPDRVTPLVTGEFPEEEESRDEADEVQRPGGDGAPVRAG